MGADASQAYDRASQHATELVGRQREIGRRDDHDRAVVRFLGARWMDPAAHRNSGESEVGGIPDIGDDQDTDGGEDWRRGAGDREQPGGRPDSALPSEAAHAGPGPDGAFPPSGALSARLMAASACAGRTASARRSLSQPS